MRSLRTIALVLAMALPSCAEPPHTALTDVAVAGGYHHQPTGLTFPDSVAGFQRVRVAASGADGMDTAIAYDLSGPAGEVAATLYLHRAPPLLTVGQPAESVAAARAQACAATLDARLVAMRRDHLGAAAPRVRPLGVVKDGELRQGTQATSSYTANFAGRTQAVRTELDLFCDVSLRGHGGWVFEFRFSAPVRQDAAPRIAAFMGALDWRPDGGA